VKTVYDAEEFRTLGHHLIDTLADYLSSAVARDIDQAIPYTDPEYQYQYWQDDLANTDDKDVHHMFTRIIDQSTKLHHPRYMGHQVGVISPVSALSSVLTSILNNGQAVYEMGMPANAIERVVSELMARHIGYDALSGGYLTSGGTIGTLSALLTARAVKTNVWDEGHTEKLAIMVSAEAHYAVDRAARIMGLGAAGVIKIPTNDKLQIDLAQLDAAYIDAKERGYRVFAVVGSVCSTSSGSYDDLIGLHRFTSAHDLWLHADGAHGGAVIFSDKYRHLTRGLDLCDSVLIDWHKMLMIPALVTAVIYKRGQEAYQTFHQRAQYLWSDPDSLDWHNGGKRTIECTKLMMGVKVYAHIKAHGTDSLGRYVDTTYDLARAFDLLISKRLGFESLVTPESNIVCFRIVNENLSINELNELNASIRKRLLADGRFYIVQTIVHEILYLRVTLMNPFTTIEDLSQLLDLIEQFSE
jgi:L-2,4-diaminobutyrate decarboxylase